MKKIVISEEEKKYIKGLYKISEQEKNPMQVVLGRAMEKLEKLKRGEIDPEEDTTTDSTSQDGTSDSLSTSNFEPGEFFVHPNAESIKNKFIDLRLDPSR